MTNNKPYIEYNDKRYEFQANWKLRKEFNKEVQQAQLEVAKGLSREEIEALEEAQRYTLEHPNLTEKDMAELPKETQEKYLKLANILTKADLSSIYEKYCFKMLNTTYGITQEDFEEMLENFSEEYGIAQVEILLQKVCEKVFTQAVEKEKKALPEWMK